MTMDTRPKQRLCLFVAIWRTSSGRLQLKVSGTNEALGLVSDPKNPTAFNEASKKLGQTVILQGVMMPTKHLKAPAPLRITEVK